ncbi:MAG: hypothetical protein IJI53_02365 [Clostridia bacterium]|nr:hypothetical protein [Clostridia bacterium]
MELLIAVFMGGALLLMVWAEEPELDEKRRINRMADESRRGWKRSKRDWTSWT